ncbi:hypothetical protein L228DRAFT_268109 [Xylona heveae TC161]|uniref:DUF7137 domain-containing protein n=1 Tax=Xylona heveae (strain CBS 132557 / TC161) TaxID=1328760 RepID=A0A165GXG0_XYLHT|nr:hypothetical protein L228DRAFT_268109 [Xylona heveae TC161]KZF22724.1 hypothetical protein L228DRAFT_268109 [Xylona heveae TC161]
MRSIQIITLLSTLFLIISVCGAWPWPPSVNLIEAPVARRDDSTTGSAAAAKTTAAAAKTTDSDKTTAKETNSKAAKTTNSSPDSASASASASGSDKGSKASATKTDTKSKTKTSSKASKTSSISIDPRVPPGGVSMITPAASVGNQYYKIGYNATFAWNYTSLSVTPKAINVLAACSENSNTYTLSLNQSVGTTNKITWDTGASQTVPFVMGTYTLIIYDAAKSVSATPSPGYLGTYDQFEFGMYIPQPYTPLSDYQCATCNGALSAAQRQAFQFMLGTVLITILSFTWFAGGFGVFN